MPSIPFCGRRTRIGSDDLYCPAFVFLIYQIPFVLTNLLYLLKFRSCAVVRPELTNFPFWFCLFAIPIHIFMACLYVFMISISTKGSIIEHERRLVMPTILHVHTSWTCIAFSFAVLGLIAWYNLNICSADARYVLAGASGIVAESCFWFIFAVCFLFGRKPYTQHSVSAVRFGQAISDRGNHHELKWERRCHKWCRCLRCVTCNIFGGRRTMHESISNAATILARLFHGSPDLVFSDFVAGCILLAAVHAHEELANPLTSKTEDEPFNETKCEPASEDMCTASIDELNASTSAISSSNNLDHILLGVSTLATDDIMPDPLEEVGLLENTQSRQNPTRSMQDLAYHSKYAIGVYGWLLIVWLRPWVGILQLICSFRCGRHKHIYGDSTLRFNESAFTLLANVNSRNIVHASFETSVYHPAYCVVLDHESKEVVVSVRGTLSLEDCLTDAVANSLSMDEVSAELVCLGEGEFAHQGFLQAAKTIYLELQRLNILKALFYGHARSDTCEAGGDYSSYNLVLVGHSLGAATAALLAVMLRPMYPKLRCLAYSPPGCTMSTGLARQCESFVTSVVLGNDIVASASLHAIEELRDKILDTIQRSRASKASMLRQLSVGRNPHELLHPVDLEAGTTSYMMHLMHYRNTLREIRNSAPVHDLTIPGRLIHIRRKRKSKKFKRGQSTSCQDEEGAHSTTSKLYEYSWADRAQFKSIRILKRFFEDHLVDNVHMTLQHCAEMLKSTTDAT